VTHSDEAYRLRGIPLGDPRERCTEPPPSDFIHGIEQFNAHEYFECHETLENLWNAEPGPSRILYKGVLQVGVGCYHFLRDNYKGAIIKLQTGADYLEPFAPACRGIDVAQLISDARGLREAIVANGPTRLDHVDRSLLPRIRLLPT
jgi:predicted metal-dependent hydrolase